MKDKSPRYFVATAVLGLTVGLLVPSASLDAQVTTSHPTTRSGAVITLSDPSSKDSAAVLGDISAIFAAIEANIETTFNKLKLATASTKSALEDQIRDLNAMTRKLKAQMDQLNALQQKVALLATILHQLDQDEQKSLQDLKEQQRKAIQHANELIVQRRSQDLQTYSQAIKIQVAKAGLDSVKAINSRYPIR
jgi:DNA repair ATPase RecN